MKNILIIIYRDILIKSTPQIFENTFEALQVIREYNYLSKEQKIENIKKAKELQDKCHSYNQTFEEIIAKIKEQNINIIKRARSSLMFSRASLGGDFPVFDEDNVNKDKNSKCFENGDEFLEGIESKQKLNETIDRISYNITSISRKNSIERYMNTNNELFLHKRMESIEVTKHKIENKIYNAIQPDSSNTFFYKYFSYILLIALICIFLIYFIFR